jgi:hypothetical protein
MWNSMKGSSLALAIGLSVVAVSVEANAQPPSEEDVAKARDLYMEAEELAKAGEWAKAADTYEQAYYLTPSKHGFAYKVGKAAWESGDCVRAEKYMSHYRTYADTSKHPEFAAEADTILNEIEFKGCAEPPPEPDESEASKKGCQVAETSPFALGVFVLSIVAFSRRRW